MHTCFRASAAYTAASQLNDARPFERRGAIRGLRAVAYPAEEAVIRSLEGICSAALQRISLDRGLVLYLMS